MSEPKLKDGWLKRQIKKAERDFKTWPKWMQREAKLDHILDKEQP